MEEKKNISEMTKEESLRQQLELLAEASKGSAFEDLPALTSSMLSVCRALDTMSMSNDTTKIPVYIGKKQIDEIIVQKYY